MAVIFTNGCFDIVHVGHVRLFEFCRKLAGPAGHVIVGLNDDESVKRLKGANRPINNVLDRAALLSALRDVDQVIVFSDDTPINLIMKIKPDIIVKGGDYSPQQVVGSDICRVEIFEYDPGHSTTKIIESLSHR